MRLGAYLLVCVLSAGTASLPAADAFAQNHEDGGATLYSYLRFGHDQSPHINIRTEQFDAHLNELVGGDYSVLPVPEIVEAFEERVKLPDGTIGITIDDMDRSVYDEAYPRLREAGLPFTLFVAPDRLDDGGATTLTWDMVREMARNGATLGTQGPGYRIIPVEGGTGPQNLPGHYNVETVRSEIARSRQRIIEETGIEPTLFAYPHGEYNALLKALVRDMGFAAAFGQQSGVAFSAGDRYALPRFVMTEPYGDIERFRLTASALPLPVRDVIPDDPYMIGANTLLFGFTVDLDENGSTGQLACFASGYGRLALHHLGSQRVEARMTEGIEPGRVRINCTMPAGDDRWRWFGAQIFMPEPPAPLVADPDAVSTWHPPVDSTTQFQAERPGSN